MSPSDGAGRQACAPPFPAASVVLDANVLMRFYNCAALHALGGAVRLVVSAHVYKECTRVGPEVRQRLRKLDLERRAITPGTLEWDELAVVRGGVCSPRDLGEDESIAICLAEATRGQAVPFATYDRRALSAAAGLGIATLDFLDTLAWLVGCGRLTAEEADTIEAKAGPCDGWKRPAGCTGSIDDVRADRQASLLAQIGRRAAEPSPGRRPAR
jgi:hypothetical protein